MLVSLFGFHLEKKRLDNPNALSNSMIHGVYLMICSRSGPVEMMLIGIPVVSLM